MNDLNFARRFDGETLEHDINEQMTKVKRPVDLAVMEFGLDLFNLDASNQTAQKVELSDEDNWPVPENALILGCSLQCTEPVKDGDEAAKTMTFRAGNADDGTQYINDVRVDDDDSNEVAYGAMAMGEELHIKADPNANWDSLEEGKWKLLILFVK